MLNAIVFDYNGVLVDDLKLQEDAYLRAAKDLGFKLSKDTARTYINYPPAKKKTLFFQDISERNWQRIFDLKKRHYYEMAGRRNLLFAGVGTVLTSLAQKYILCLLSNSFREPFERIFPPQLAGLFRVTLFADEVHHPKPSPEPLFRIMEALRIGLDECCYVGDSITDVQMAKDAGVKIFTVTTGIHSYRNLRAAGADAVATSLEEVAGQIEMYARFSA